MRQFSYKPLMKYILLMLALSVSSFAAEKQCAFGQDLTALSKNTRFTSKELFATFKLSREKNPVNPLLWVHVSELTDTQTGRIYQMNATNEDQYDGGNTLGWIEDVTKADDGVDDSKTPDSLTDTGAVVAEISDSWINCVLDVK